MTTVSLFAPRSGWGHGPKLRCPLELLPVPYFHVVFTVPAQISAIAYRSRAVVYELLFKASSCTSTPSTRSVEPRPLLAYLSRYTHRAIFNCRLIALNSRGATFRYKGYRADGRARYKVIRRVNCSKHCARVCDALCVA